MCIRVDVHTSISMVEIQTDNDRTMSSLQQIFLLKKLVFEGGKNRFGDRFGFQQVTTFSSFINWMNWRVFAKKYFEQKWLPMALKLRDEILSNGCATAAVIINFLMSLWKETYRAKYLMRGT